MVKFDKQDNNDCLTCKRRSGMFNLLSKEELQVIRENRITIHYGVGEIIQKQGTSMTHVISVNAGLVKLYLEGDSHSKTILRIVFLLCMHILSFLKLEGGSLFNF